MADGDIDAAAKASLRSALAAPDAAASDAGDDAYEPDADAVCAHFSRRAARRPDAAARYDYGAAPLWPSATPPPDPPNCACGARRRFEVQLLPTVAYHLGSDGLDVATLLVFSCADSCAVSTDEAVAVFEGQRLQEGVSGERR